MTRRPPAAVATLVVATFLVALAAPALADAAPRRNCSLPTAPRTFTYTQRPGFPAQLTSLDVWAPKPVCRLPGRRAPVVVWVHGGGYQIGDKANQAPKKARLFNARGYVFVSVNYRLTRTGDPASAHWPDHFRDVAAAIGWIRTHIATFGGNARRLALLGHSAGADIVSNIATDPQWLAAKGLPLRAIKCVGPFDTAGFDKTRVPAGTDESAMWQEALGTAPDYTRTTSATLLARPGSGVRGAITVVRGIPLRRSIETAFAERMRAVGVPTTVIDASGLTHEGVNTSIGAPGDTVMTPPLMRFLRDCLHA